MTLLKKVKAIAGVQIATFYSTYVIERGNEYHKPAPD